MCRICAEKKHGCGWLFAKIWVIIEPYFPLIRQKFYVDSTLNLVYSIPMHDFFFANGIRV